VIGPSVLATSSDSSCADVNECRHESGMCNNRCQQSQKISLESCSGCDGSVGDTHTEILNIL